MPPRARPLAERFVEKLERQGACLVFTGPTTRRGYGTIGAGGRAGRALAAHRVAYELAHGPIPPGASVLHSCDMPPCCEPTHLFLGTASDNMHDAASKDRLRPPGAKLSPAQRADAIHRYLTGETARSLASELGVTAKAIENLVYSHRRRQSRA